MGLPGPRVHLAAEQPSCFELSPGEAHMSAHPFFRVTDLTPSWEPEGVELRQSASFHHVAQFYESEAFLAHTVGDAFAGLTVVLAFTQVVAPPIGGVVLDHSAHGVTLLFTAAAVAFLASSLAFLGHRSRQSREPS